MSVLFRNDTLGQFPDSWYAATVDAPDLNPKLVGDHRADVVIVGAGFTGLWAAKTLAQAGLSVRVLDAHRAGFGASGRNGGQVSSGYNKDQQVLEKRLGQTTARALWDISQEAKAQLVEFCATNAPDARYTSGVAHGAYTTAEVRDEHEAAAYLGAQYGYDQVVPLDRAEMQDLVKTPLYHGGILDRGAGHVHPLRYALALAREAQSSGAVLHDQSEVIRVDQGTPVKVITKDGQVTADHLILAGNGYLTNLVSDVASRVMPINSFICATAPLGDAWRDVLAQDIAVADSKFVVNYYRMSEDRRLLFGGRESYTIGFPRDISTALTTRMTTLFPQLKGVGIDYVWGGSLGITMSRLPCLQRIGPNILSGAGFSGHGVALSGMAGRVMAEAIIGQTGRFDVMSQLPTPRFPGGAAFRTPLMTLAMTWYSLRDRLGV